MSRVKELDRGLGDIALERLRPIGEEERIIPSPNRQQRRLVLPKIFLKPRIKRDVVDVILEKVQLKFIRAGTREIKSSNERPSGETRLVSATPCV
jgi:hypothetical protein